MALQKINVSHST